jgi:general secretion pathway protein N
MRRRLYWLAPLVGAAALLLGLVVLMPVAALWTWFAPPVEQLVVRQLQGSLLQGRALGVTATGLQGSVQKLAWRWQPAALLSGQWGYALDAMALDTPLVARAGVSALGNLIVTDAVSGGPIKTLAQAVGQNFVPISGNWRLKIDRARLSGNWPSDLAGRATLQEVKWALGAPPIPLGDYQADLTTEDDAGTTVLLATLRSLDGGPVELEGQARLWPDRRYVTDLRLRPLPGAPAMIPNLLANTGQQPDAQGWYRLQQQGQLP